MLLLHGKGIYLWTHHHHGDDAGLGSLPRLVNWGQPAAHQGLFLNEQVSTYGYGSSSIIVIISTINCRQRVAELQGVVLSTFLDTTTTWKSRGRDSPLDPTANQAKCLSISWNSSLVNLISHTTMAKWRRGASSNGYHPPLHTQATHIPGVPRSLPNKPC